MTQDTSTLPPLEFLDEAARLAGWADYERCYLAHRGVIINHARTLQKLAALEAENAWRPIEEAPEGDDDNGPFFDVLWEGEQHRYLPVPARSINCFKERGTVKMEHGYPSVTTIFNPQPTHFRPLPSPPAQGDGA